MKKKKAPTPALPEQPHFLKEIYSQEKTEAILELPAKIDLPSYQFAVGIVRAIHKQLRVHDSTMKIKYAVEREPADSQVSCKSKGELGVFLYHWRKAGSGPAGQLSFSENFKNEWPEGKHFDVKQYSTLRLKTKRPPPPQPPALRSIQIVVPSLLSYLSGFAK